ncbi:hypothetical protein ScPMuIL_012309 [Solemya velum]
MAASIERLILQSDWHQSLRETDGRAWVTFKSSVHTSIHGELQTHGLSNEGLPYVVASEGFTVQDVTQRKIGLTYSGEPAICTRQFLAPVVAFSTIHTIGKNVYALDVTSGGLGVSSDSEGKLKVWETSTGEVRRNLEGHVFDIYTCRFFPSGIVMLTGGGDMQLKIWSVETGQCAATLKEHRSAILDTAIIDRGRNVLSCSRDGTAKLWDCGEQKCLYSFDECGGDLNSCALGIPENSISLGQSDYIPNEREILTDGKMLLLACENKTLQGYGLQSKSKIFELPCHDAVNCCCFLSSTTAVCGTQDGHLTVVDLRNIRVPLKEWRESRGPILSLLAHGQGFFASTGDGSCFHVNGQNETVLELTGSDCDPLYKVASDGTHIYTCCRDGQIRKYGLNIVGL